MDVQVKNNKKEILQAKTGGGAPISFLGSSDM
jgi:hypothetical protein